MSTTQRRVLDRLIPRQLSYFSGRFSPVGPVSQTSALAVMTCRSCELTGGPFSQAEAAHLVEIHDRLHHGGVASAQPSSGQ